MTVQLTTETLRTARAFRATREIESNVIAIWRVRIGGEDGVIVVGR